MQTRQLQFPMNGQVEGISDSHHIAVIIEIVP